MKLRDQILGLDDDTSNILDETLSLDKLFTGNRGKSSNNLSDTIADADTDGEDDIAPTVTKAGRATKRPAHLKGYDLS